VQLAGGLTKVQRDLLTDPQTSGGLLVACDDASVDEVLRIFKTGGFDGAAVIGEIKSGPPQLQVR
jgi:selenide,water dikinase